MADLKIVYAAVDENAALDALENFAEHWNKKYPKISASWRDNWPSTSLIGCRIKPTGTLTGGCIAANMAVKGTV